MCEAYKIDHYAVFGNPVEHSLSPLIHQEFAQQMHESLIYTKQLIPLNGFAKAVHQFQAQGGRGINITLPFKQEAWQLADVVCPSAARAQAVNTFKFLEDGKIEGHNTDGIGLLIDLKQNKQIEIQNKRVLVLGAGGAARGVLEALLAERPELIVIANRTIAKAQALARAFADLGAIKASHFETLTHWTFDIAINATSASLKGEMLPLPVGIIKPQGCCYDMVYGKPLPFLIWAKNLSIKYCFDGLGMLVEQAAEAFFIWRNVRPKTQSVIQKLQKMMNQHAE